jgi:hypothetical protein
MCACAHFVCLSPFLPANFKEQGGKSQCFHKHVRDPSGGDAIVKMRSVNHICDVTSCKWHQKVLCPSLGVGKIQHA